MQKNYTPSEQFIIKFYQFFKLQTRAQQELLADKTLAKALIDEFLEG